MKCSRHPSLDFVQVYHLVSVIPEAFPLLAASVLKVCLGQNQLPVVFCVVPTTNMEQTFAVFQHKLISL